MAEAMEAAVRDYVGAITNSRRWKAFEPRAGDIVVCTPPESGTTWTQGIVAMLIAGAAEVDAPTSIKSPWIDTMSRPIEEVIAHLTAQDHRRQVKTHTPIDGIPLWAELRYITVYRHPIDVHFSLRKHVANQKKAVPWHGLIPDNPSDSFRIFLEGDHWEGASLSSIIEHYRETLKREPRENLLRLHYADMLADLDDAVARIAAHVRIAHPPELMAAVVNAANFENMKANASNFAPAAGKDFWHSDDGFFDSATSNKWEGQLTAEDLATYDARMATLLTPEERLWLEWGRAGP